jgi:hypothetical protein
MAQLERGKLCPLLKKDCVGLQCSWYTHVRGTEPQSGREVDEYACAVTWMPMLLIETSKEVRQGAAATESLRNQVVDTLVPALNLQSAVSALQGISKLSAVPDGRQG